KVYVIANPSTAQNGGAGGAQALVTGGLLRVNANLTVNADYAIRINDVNGATVAVAPNVTVSGTRALQLHNVNVHPNCSINIAGAMTASTVYTLMDSKKNDTNCDHAVFNFLNGAIVSGPQNAASGIQTRNAAFMTFGYASGENGDTLGDAIGVAYGTGSDTGALTKVDNSAVINIGVPITKVDSGIWTAYVAAGTTNFYDERTSTSTDPQKEIGAMYVGAAGFTETDLIPKTDNAYTATKIVPVVGAKATVNFGKDGDTGTNHYHITIRNLTINSGGTVNVTNHARLGVSTALDLNGGTLNIASGCTIPINNATITAASGTSTINGVIPSATASAITVTPKNFMVAEGATLNLNNVVINKSIGDGTFRVNGTLVFNGKSGVTMTAGERVTYVAGTLINNCSDDLDLKGVNANSTNWIFVSGGRPTIGVGTGWVNFSTSLRNNSCPAIDLLVLGKVKSGFTDSTKTNTAGFYIADDKTYSLHGVHVHTCGGTFTVDGTLEFAGDTKDDGVLTIDNKAGGDNRNCYVTTVTVAADKYGTLNGNVIGFNDAKNLQTVTINDGGTLRYGMTNVTAPNITTLNLHGTLTNQRAAGAAALAVTNLSVAAGKSGALSGTGKTTVATPVVAGNLAIDGADVAFTGAVAGGGGVAVKNSGALATVGGALGAMTLDGGTLTNSAAALEVASMSAKGSSLVSGAAAVNADALSVASGTLTFDNPGAITAADVSSGGALVLKNGALAAATVAGTLDYQKTGATDLTLAGGTAKVAAGQTLTAATVSGFGTLSGPGETAVATLTATGGTLTKSAPGA
ncbi:MAG: hypothetical protein J6333_04370, partial [Planctomycetes bacterium]|nr:hypothetical protein [Planctomycetota bacterium]